MNSAGLYIADTYNCRVVEIPWSAGTQWGISMTAGDLYVVAGTGTCGTGPDGGKATLSKLDDPEQVFLGAGTSAGSLYIADSGNNRIQELAGVLGTQWNQSMTADDVYTVVGSASGASGATAGGGAGTSTLLEDPSGVAVGSGGNLFVSDSANCRVLLEPNGSGTSWGITVTANDAYVLAGRTGGCAIGDDDKVSTQSDLDDPGQVWAGNGNLYIADTGNNRIQEVAGATETERGVSMTDTYVYTVAGSSNATGGYSGDGGAARSAELNQPGGLWIDGSDDVYIPDTENNRVREVSGLDVRHLDDRGNRRRRDHRRGRRPGGRCRA